MTRSRETASARKWGCRRSWARRRKHEPREWWQIEARRFAAELAPECQLLDQRALLPVVRLDRVVVGQRSDQPGDPGTQLECGIRGGAGRELTNVRTRRLRRTVSTPMELTMTGRCARCAGRTRACVPSPQPLASRHADQVRGRRRGGVERVYGNRTRRSA